MEPLNITIGDIEMEVEVSDASVDKGELSVSSAEVTFGDSVYYEFEDNISWDKETVKEAIRSEWMEKGRWPDVSEVEDWQEPKTIRTGTDRWKVMQYVVSNAPVTARRAKEDLGDDISVGSALYGLEELNLIKSIDRVGGGNVRVPTHIAFKELYCVHGAKLRKHGVLGNYEDIDSEGEGEQKGLSKLFGDDKPVNTDET